MRGLTNYDSQFISLRCNPLYLVYLLKMSHKTSTESILLLVMPLTYETCQQRKKTKTKHFGYKTRPFVALVICLCNSSFHISPHKNVHTHRHAYTHTRTHTTPTKPSSPLLSTSNLVEPSKQTQPSVSH